MTYSTLMALHERFAPITRGGVYSTPSAQVGSSREFAEAKLLTKLDAVAGFILAAIVDFPIVAVFKVPVRSREALVREQGAECRSLRRDPSSPEYKMPHSIAS